MATMTIKHNVHCLYSEYDFVNGFMFSTLSFNTLNNVTSYLFQNKDHIICTTVFT